MEILQCMFNADVWFLQETFGKGTEAPNCLASYTLFLAGAVGTTPIAFRRPAIVTHPRLRAEWVAS
eukprot:5366554-Prorocentrum_lima.AAC.1